jgi:hypothetical protein
MELGSVSMVVLGFAAVFAASLLYIIILAFHRKLNNPEKKLVFCFLNESLNLVRFLKLGPYRKGELNVDDCLKAAFKRAKLTDLGDDDFFNVYKLVMNAPFQKKQRYTNIGYIVAQMELTMTFGERLAKINYIKQHPEILNVPVREPVFVFGLLSGRKYF